MKNLLSLETVYVFRLLFVTVVNGCYCRELIEMLA